MDRNHSPIDDYLDGELTGDACRRLGDWLRERDENVREFALQSLIHSLLHDFISQRQVQADALLRATTAKHVEPCAEAAGAERRSAGRVALGPANVPYAGPGHSPIGGRSRSRRSFGLAAVVLVAVTAGTIVYLASRPTAVATLTQTANCLWGEHELAIADGAQFYPGDELNLIQGRALVTFVSGARVVLDGPATLITRSESSASLSTGALTAIVPSQAIGFTIHTPLCRLVDLGTEFTARINSDRSFELQVFDGLVELSLVGLDNQVEDVPLRLSEGVAVKIGWESRKVDTIAYNPEEKMEWP